MSLNDIVFILIIYIYINFWFNQTNNVHVYLNFIEKNYENNELENQYQDYTKLYDKKEFDWLYYYVFVILFINFDSNIDSDIYEKIIAVMVVQM
jgi:hypothetical protein